MPQASASVKIAVIDSGVQYNHLDLFNVTPGYDAHTDTTPNQFTQNSHHGTRVTGFIAAIPNNGEAVAGIAYGATVVPISFSVDVLGHIMSSPEVLVRAINRAVTEGAKVINCSWYYEGSQQIVDAVLCK